ncbi:MAG: heme ABC exporter ATP-binding protein CcmA [Pseudomonadota bacterium]
MPEAIALRGLVCQRAGRDLFAPLDLRVEAGSLVELRGANGSGKSTLLRTLNGVHQQYRGQFTIDPCLFQGHRLGLDELLSPLENLRFAAALHDRQLDEDGAFAALERFGVVRYGLTRMADLSAGQQRRVAMARWYLAALPVWLLDEPFTALDADGQALLTQLMVEHCATGGVIVCATHMPVPIEAKTLLSLAMVA